MTTVTYSKTSPYYGTGLYGQFLDVRINRPITKLATDVLFAITRVYHLRPDLLANDLYGNPKLWWVFSARNPNSMKDPLFDFIAGNQIYLPDKTQLFADLGL